MAAERAEFLGRPSVIARRSDFKVKWFATRLHTFLIATSFVSTPAADELDVFLRGSREHAVANKGGLPRGLQTGTAAIAAALVPEVPPGLSEWARRSHARRFAAITFPVLADLSTGSLVHPERMVVGGIYRRHLRGVACAVVGTAISRGHEG